jgi:hypothetical protein
VKFFDPTISVSARALRQPASASVPPAASRRNRAGQDHRITGHGHTAKNKDAEAARADSRRNRRHADTNHRGHAHAREDHAHRERQLDLPQRLARRHAHGSRGFDHRRVHAGDARVGVAENRQQRVESERDDCGAGADAAEHRHRKQESEQRQARHRLHHVGRAEHPTPQHAPPHQRDSQWHADKHRDRHGCRYQPQMLEGPLQNFGALLHEEVQYVHG